MRVLLDTCVVAGLRDPRGDPAVKATVDLVPDDDLYLSVLSLGEIAAAIDRLPVGRKKKGLEAWLAGLDGPFADRILPVDRDTARLWGGLSARAQRAGLILPAVDGLLAATALRHGLHLMTRKAQHLEITGVPIIDPWSGP